MSNDHLRFKKSALILAVGLIVVVYFIYHIVNNNINQSRVLQIQDDINNLEKTSESISSEVCYGVLDSTEAIKEITDIEQKVRWKIGDLNVAIQKSQLDMLAGKTSQDFGRKILTMLMAQRFAIEKYKIDGNLKNLCDSINYLRSGE